LAASRQHLDSIVGMQRRLIAILGCRLNKRVLATTVFNLGRIKRVGLDSQRGRVPAPPDADPMR